MARLAFATVFALLLSCGPKDATDDDPDGATDGADDSGSGGGTDGGTDGGGTDGGGTDGGGTDGGETDSGTGGGSSGGGTGGGEVDEDGDGFTSAEDCNDADARVNPEARESCNGVDDDCDGEVDEDMSTTFYADADGDGYGDPGLSVEGCEPPAGFTVNATDCDDGDATTNPGAEEACDGRDNNCDGVVDERC